MPIESPWLRIPSVIRWITVCTCFFALTSPVLAEPADHRIEVALGLGHSERQGFELTSMALRWHRILNDRWGITFTLGSDDVADLDRSNIHFDVSGRRVLRQTPNSQIYGLFGLGIVQYEDINISLVHNPFGPAGTILSDYDTGTTETAHVGLGWMRDFGERWFISTEFRYRAHRDAPEVLGDDSYELTFGIGWKF